MLAGLVLEAQTSLGLLYMRKIGQFLVRLRFWPLQKLGSSHRYLPRKTL